MIIKKIKAGTRIEEGQIVTFERKARDLFRKRAYPIKMED